MKLTEIQGDLFEVDRKKWVLVHCISEDVTERKNMNKGIAKKFRFEYPEMAKAIEPLLKVGKAIRYEKNGSVIYNLVTKHKVWQKARGVYKDQYYSQLHKALLHMKDQLIKSGKKYLAMPRIASGLDGGDWIIIKKMINEVFEDSGVVIEVRYLK